MQPILKEAELALYALLDGKERLELLTILEREDDIESASRAAAALAKDTSAIFVLGIGGSSLGGQTLRDLAPDAHGRPPVAFLDNPDPASFMRVLAQCDLKTTRFLSVSKSGGTAETLAQTLVAADAIACAGGERYLKRHFAVITEPKPSPLRKFAEDIGCVIVDHPLGIGGRYLVLTAVGLLPAILMGLDPRALRAGARAAVASASSPGSALATGAAQYWALVRARKIRESVLWCYSDRLKTFAHWWRQLWGESLGKEGQGTTPVAALGPVDQHSQLQLFLDGPGDAVFTFIDAGTGDAGGMIPESAAAKYGVSYLGGRSLGELVDAECRATAETLAAHSRSVRHIHVPVLDEKAMGALFMYFMLETILVGRLMGIDPFDQPAVEEGKRLARTYLEGKHR